MERYEPVKELWKIWACEMITEKLDFVKGLLECVSL
jgi:hypothetical protein